MLRRGIILFALLNLCSAQGFGLSDLSSIINFVTEAYSVYNEIKADVKTWQDVVTLGINVVQTIAQRQESAMQKLGNKLNSLSEQVENLQHMAENRLNRLDALLTRLPAEIEQSSLKNDIAKSIRFVNKQYERFRQYSNNETTFNNVTLMSFSASVTDQDSDGVESRLDEIFHIVVPSSSVGTTILGAMIKDGPQGEVDDCIYTRSTQQSLFDLYNTLIFTELFGFLVIGYAYDLQIIFHNVSVEAEMKAARQGTLDRVDKYHDAFADAMKVLPRSFGACRSITKHIQGETYIEMTGLFQAIVTVDYNLVEEGSCSASCEDINQVRDVDKCYIKDGESNDLIEAKKVEDCPNPKPCTGRLRDCITLSSTHVCISIGNTRRYEWFTDASNIEYGPAHGHLCKGGVKMFNSWRKGWKFRHCEFCACICDNTDEASKDRHIISFLEARSDTENNKILTGCRFRREDNVLHIQIKQGVLEENGYINRATEEWLPIEDLKNYVENIQAKEGDSTPWTEFGEGKYFTVIGSRKNAVHLDDVVVPFGRCVTGLRFGSSRSGIAIFVESIEFDYITGKLVPGSNQWISELTRKMLQLPLDDLDNPLLASGPNIQDSGANHFVRFTISSLRKDAGQSVVPFIDARNVEANPSTPLGGMGLHHKNIEGYGGFLAFKMYSLDYGKLLIHGKLKAHRELEDNES